MYDEIQFCLCGTQAVPASFWNTDEDISCLHQHTIQILHVYCGQKTMELCRLSFTRHLRCSKRTQRGSRSCSRRTWVSHMSWVRSADREALSQISYSISKGSVHSSMLMWQNCAQNTDWAVYTWFKTSFPEQIKKNNLRAAPLLFPSSQKLGAKFSPVTPKTAWLMRF